jgi:hypothetical protein
MAKPAIVVVQSFQYRDQPEEFSNKYHFAGPAPGDDTSWKALADSLINVLRPAFTSSISFVRAYGYNDGDHPSVWGHDYAIPGPPFVGSAPAPTDGIPVPGDAAVMARWPTVKRNSRGKIVYARKYYHGIAGLGSDADKVSNIQKALLTTAMGKLLDGTVSSVFHLCLPDGTPALAGDVSIWMTTRTLKRRGKRPPT